MTITSRMRNNRSPRRLPGETRILCLIGVFMAAVVIVAAAFILPCLWAHRKVEALALLNQPCLLKAATGVPCPFCGGSRSAVAATRGQFVQSLKLSPLGIPVIWGSAFFGVWLLLCALSGRDLGLRAARKLLAKAPIGRILIIGLALLWAFKIVTDCLLQWD